MNNKNRRKEYSFVDLVDIEEVRKTFESLQKVTNVPTAILDPENNILMEFGWQDVCTNFHRVNEKSLEECKKSDSYILDHLGEGEFVEYKCQHGLWDAALPVIVEGEHLATVFMGQYFYEGEELDRDIIVKQAEKYGFDKKKYLEEFSKVSHYSREFIKSRMQIYVNIVALLSRQGLSEIKAKKSEARVRQIIDYSNDWETFRNKEGKLLYVNSAMEKMIGYSAKDFIAGRISLEDFLLPEDLAKGKEFQKKTILGEVFRNVEIRFRAKDGRIVYCFASSQPVYDEYGNFVGSRASLSNVTELKKAEEEIRNLAKFPSENPNPVIRIARDGKILYSNEAAGKVLKGWNTAIGKEVPEKWRQTIEKAFEEGKSLLEEEKVGDCLLSFSVSPVGGSGYANLYARDITKTKKAELEAENYNKLLQKIINLLSIRVFWKDKNLRYLGCNEIFAKDSGKDRPEDLVGKDDFQMGWKDQAEEYRADDQKVINSKKPKINFEELQTTPDGNKIWLKTSKVPLIDTEGNEIGILGTYEDITERKQREIEMEKRLHELEVYHKATVDRELRMIELKKEIKRLREQLGSPGSHGV